MRVNLYGKSMVDQAIEIMQHYEPEEGYWLAFSGGKDSMVLHRLAEMAGVKFDAHYNLTTIDPPELVQFIRRQYPAVAWNRPERTFTEWMQTKGLPTRRRRWCCDVLKERGGRGRFVLTGIRAEESPARQRRGTVERCYRDPSRTYVNPIRGWKTGEVWDFIRGEGMAHCALYDEGWRRLGCVPCPFEQRVAASMARWPRIWENCRRGYQRWWETHDETYAAKLRWRTADEAFDWWCSRNEPYPDLLDEPDQQPALFV